MGLILKGVGTFLIFSIFLFFGTWYTLLQVVFGKKKNEELKNNAKNLNINAAQNLNCGAKSSYVVC